MKRTIMICLIGLLLIGAFSTGQIQQEYLVSQIDEGGTFVLSQLTEHAPITISSNGQFGSEGASGSGTEADPFVFDGMNITSTGLLVNISDTDAYFEFRNCYFDLYGEMASYEETVLLDNVQYGSFKDCKFRGGLGIKVSWSDNCSIVRSLVYNASIYFVSSYDCSIVNNTVWGYDGWGIRVKWCIDLEVIGNLVHSTDIGIHTQELTSPSIWNNTLVGNNQYGILSGGPDLFKWNRLGWNTIANGFDMSNSHEWDMGEGQGNYWHDYDGSGWYFTSGSYSYDRYPSILVDDVNPTVEATYEISNFDFVETVEFTITATDNIAVAEVILSYSTDGEATWTNVSTQVSDDLESWTVWIPRGESGADIHYKLYASDYSGLWSADDTSYLVEIPEEPTTPTGGTTPPDSTTPTGPTNTTPGPPVELLPLETLMLVGGALGVVIIVVLVIVVRRR